MRGLEAVGKAEDTQMEVREDYCERDFGGQPVPNF
jgi:hypothetical protein